MAPDGRTSILPAGTVTFLLVDVVGPARHSAPGPAPGRPSGPAPGPGPGPASAGPRGILTSAVDADVVDRSRTLVVQAVAGHGGRLAAMEGDVDHDGEGDGPRDGEGDVGARRGPGRDRGSGEPPGILAVFTSAEEAVAAALDIQRAARAEVGPGGVSPAIRIGLHTGGALLRDDRYHTGPALHRGARLRDVAHGGQTLLSEATAALVAEALPAGAWLEDLGAHRLRDLSRPERVLELRHPDLPGDLPPLRSLDALANNLPIQLTRFVGRGDELATVELLLGSERLVTLTGSGGCGKTRLAVQAAAELADRWPDGVWWIDLSSLADPARVAELVASMMGVLVEPIGGPLRSLARHLRDRSLLVCLDNCEHLLDGCAELAETLLLECPQVSVLATSREPLAVPGETVWRVPSLAEGEAVALFVDRASRVRPWFTLNDSSEAAVRTLCRRLDGIPLAIELAAAWLRTLTPAQIAAGLDDRFSLLVRGPRGAVARHQTLAASIDWSHDLLDDTDRIVFRRLAVFAGGFSLDAARAVAAADPVSEAQVLVVLGGLVDKSLVVMDEREGEARYRMLETIRQYASARLDAAGETAAARDRHLDHFLALALEAEPELVDKDQEAWLDRLEVEHDNLRAAMEWGLAADDPERARRLASVLLWLWYLRGHTNEGVDFLRRAIDRAPDDRTWVQPNLCAGVAAVSVASGQTDLMLEYSLRGLEVATAIGDEDVRASCLLLLGVAQSFLDFDAARELFDQAQRAAELGQQNPSRPGVSRMTANRLVVMQGVLHAYRDRYDDARPLLQEGYERCLGRGDRGFASVALDYLAVAALVGGDPHRGEELATQAYEIAQPRGDYYDVGRAAARLALVKTFTGDLATGWQVTEPIVRSVEGTTHTLYVPRLAQAMGRLSLLAGDFERSVAWYERDVRDEGPMADSHITAQSLPGLAGALRHLGRVDEARARAERGLALARRLGTPQLTADALEQLAHLVGPDDPKQAEDLHHEALAVRVEHGLRLFQVDSLDALAGLAARVESFAEAARLLAASDAARAEMGYPRPTIDAPDNDALVARLRSALGETGFGEAWDEGAKLSLDEAVGYVRRARGSRSRPATGWASLTPTEMDVVRLVAEGLSNPEIGARLFVSRATVKTHLSHVYAKLGITNRTELATLASKHLAGP